MILNNVGTQTKSFIVTTDPRFEPVSRELAELDIRLREIPANQNQLLTAATERLISAGGKRLRPVISLHSSAVAGAETEQAILLAAGVEMLHTATLVHDDLIDHSVKRRGLPTLNSYNSPATTVLTGDYLFARAAQLVAQTGDVRVTEMFANTLMVILNGEIEQRFSRWKIDREEYNRRIYAKTAALFVLATEAAAVMAQADDLTKEALTEYGRNAGMAFQIIDDILDFIGDEAKTGKPTGSDLTQGLFTLPAILYAQSHPDDPKIEALITNLNREPELIRAVIDDISGSRSIALAQQEARQYISEALFWLHKLPPSKHNDALESIAKSVIDRSH